jgi:hypothetical protein
MVSFKFVFSFDNWNYQIVSGLSGTDFVHILMVGSYSLLATALPLANKKSVSLFAMAIPNE